MSGSRKSSRQILSALLATQLMAAEVYADFLRLSSEGEHELWGKMLDHELDYVTELHKLLRSNQVVDIDLPEINLIRLREITSQILDSSNDLFMVRLEGALRLETAELDYGLEGMSVRRMQRRKVSIQNDVLAIRSHIATLLEAADRYKEARNIGLLIRRLRDLTEASTTDTQHYDRGDTPSPS